jgi:general secretion pathway protein G
MFLANRVSFSNLKRLLRKPFAAGQGNKAMTLLEIIIVVALLGTLMAILVNNLTSSQDSAREGQAEIGMGGIAQALQLYRVNNMVYPTTAQGLGALVSYPGNAKAWRGPYLDKEKLNDPWGNAYEYTSDGRAFEIVSGGIPGGTRKLYYPKKDAPEAAPAEQPAQ